jgi:hypothetical protein
VIYDEAGPQLADDRSGLLGADRRAAPDRDKEHVDLADREGLFVAQHSLAEIAEVTQS